MEVLVMMNVTYANASAVSSDAVVDGQDLVSPECITMIVVRGLKDFGYEVPLEDQTTIQDFVAGLAESISDFNKISQDMLRGILIGYIMSL
jgi:glucose uptake protein GlcU